MTEFLHKPDAKIADESTPAPVANAVITDRAGQNEYKAAVAQMRPATLPDQSSPILSHNTEEFAKFQGIYNRLHAGGMPFAELQNDVRSIVTGMGLPPVDFEFRKQKLNEEEAGGYAPGQGRVNLVGGISSDLFVTEVAAHEVTHYDQDLLVARRMMDRLGVTDNVSDSQIRQLQNMYRDEVGEKEPADEQFLRTAAAWRAGQKLTPAEEKRADELITAMHDWNTHPDLPHDLEQEMVRHALPEIFSMETPRQSVQQLLDQADTGTGLCNVGMFGTNRKITRQDIIAQFGDPKDPSFDSDKAARALADQLKAREAEFKHQFDAYAAGKHEAEARGVEAQFKQFAIDHGADPNEKYCDITVDKVACGK